MQKQTREFSYIQRDIEEFYKNVKCCFSHFFCFGKYSYFLWKYVFMLAYITNNTEQINLYGNMEHDTFRTHFPVK